MPSKLTTIANKIDLIPNQTNANLVSRVATRESAKNN
jgi:hypothetical protein